MRFFERLAPAARAQHAVHPVVPPRLAPAGVGAGELEEAPATLALQSPAVESPAPRRALEASPGDPPGEAAPAAGAPGAVEAIDGPAPHGAVRPPPPGMPRGAPPSPAPPVAPVDAPPTGRPAPGVVAPALLLAPQRAPRGTAPPVEVAPPPSRPADGTDAPTLRRPLSPMALAQRLSPARHDGPEIVQVTIDRIDVRAPAPVAPPRAPARARPAPTTSLADYLRRGRS